MRLMDIEQIKADAPEDAAFWSPAVEQYFDRQYMNLAFKEQGKLIQVEKPFRAQLVPLTK
ncbi:hypothetical protein FG071_13885 [Vibrio cholerae]|nr:hypothetical protein [Vibrio cholerae]